MQRISATLAVALLAVPVWRDDLDREPDESSTPPSLEEGLHRPEVPGGPEWLVFAIGLLILAAGIWYSMRS
jgi:hypothetical protein